MNLTYCLLAAATCGTYLATHAMMSTIDPEAIRQEDLDAYHHALGKRQSLTVYTEEKGSIIEQQIFYFPTETITLILNDYEKFKNHLSPTEKQSLHAGVENWLYASFKESPEHMNVARDITDFFWNCGYDDGFAKGYHTPGIQKKTYASLIKRAGLLICVVSTIGGLIGIWTMITADH